MAEADLIERLEKLERDNRRLKWLALLPLVLIAALGAIYATRPVPQKITAHEFDVVNAADAVRVAIAAGTLSFLDSKGKPGLVLSANDYGSSVSLADAFGQSMKLYVGGNSKWGMSELDLVGNKGAITIGTLFTPSIQLRDEARVNRVELGIGGPVAVPQALGVPEIGSGGYLGLWDANDKLRLFADDSPRIELADSNGYMASLGRTELVAATTGETSKTSAASIVMFGSDKKHHVIWQAP